MPTHSERKQGQLKCSHSYPALLTGVCYHRWPRSNQHMAISRLSPNMVPLEATELPQSRRVAQQFCLHSLYQIQKHTALEKLITLEFGPSHCLQLNSSILRPWRTPIRTLFPSPLQLTVFHNSASDELWKKRAVIWHSTSRGTAKRLKEYPQLQQNFYHTHVQRNVCREKY